MKRLWPFAIAAVIVSLLGIAGGIYQLQIGIPKQLNEPGLRFVAGYLPIGMALLLLVMPVLAFNAYRGKRFTLRPDCLLYENGKQELAIRWGNVTLLKPQRIKGSFMVATVSDGTQFARIEQFFFPQFEEILTEIDYQRRAARSEHSV